MRALLVVNVASEKNLTLQNSRHLSALISGKICENLREILQHFKQLQCSEEFSRRFPQIAAQICADFFLQPIFNSQSTDNPRLRRGGIAPHDSRLPITRAYGAGCAT